MPDELIVTSAAAQEASDALQRRARALQGEHQLDINSATFMAYAEAGRLRDFGQSLTSWLLSRREAFQDGTMSIEMACALDRYMLGWRYFTPDDLDKARFILRGRVDPTWGRDYLTAMREASAGAHDPDLGSWIRPFRRHSENGDLPDTLGKALEALWPSWRVRQYSRRGAQAA